MMRSSSLPNLCLASCFLAALVGGSPVVGQTPAAEPSASSSDPSPRWTEGTYGISLLPPAGSTQWEGPRVLWANPAGFTVSFELIFSKVPFNLEQVAAATLVQMGFARSLPTLETDEQGQPITPRPERIGDRPGIKMYFDIEEDDGTRWQYGQAIMMIEPHAAAVIKLKGSIDTAEAGRAAFEQTLASIHVPLASELDEQRGEQVEAADTWLKTVTPQQIREATPELQLYRMQLHGQDVGYIRLEGISDAERLKARGHQPPGMLVIVRQRQYIDGKAVDTEAGAFASDDGQGEVWSHRTTVRSDGRTAEDAGRPAGLPSKTKAVDTTTRSWVQTGIRGNQQLTAGRGPRQQTWDVNAVTVVTESPPNDETVAQIEAHEQFTGKAGNGHLVGKTEVSEWRAPDKAYLPQVMLPVFTQMLPRKAATYTFTAYHTASGEPGLRTVDVIPQDDGGTIIRDRPTPKVSPNLTFLDPQGNLIRRVMPNGLIIEPTTPEKLQEIWQDR